MNIGAKQSNAMQNQASNAMQSNATQRESKQSETKQNNVNHNSIKQNYAMPRDCRHIFYVLGQTDRPTDRQSPGVGWAGGVTPWRKEF